MHRVASGRSPRKRKRSTREDIQPAKQSKTALLAESTAVKGKSPEISPSRVRGKEDREIVHSLLQTTFEDAGKGKRKSPRKKARGKEEAELLNSLLQSSSSEGSSSSEDESEQITKPRPNPKSKSAAKPSDNESSSQSSDSQKEACKEPVTDDYDVEVLVRGGSGAELERFDNDVEYKNRVLYKLNPLFSLKRCGPLEKDLGLRSVADVTPEKRSTRSSRLSVRPQTHRHARESSRDTADGDTEVKELIRSNLERRTSARANSVREQERTKRSDERAKPAPDQKKKTKEKDRTRRNKGTKDDESVLLNNNSDSNSAGNRRKTRRRSKGAKDHKYVLVNDNSDNKCARNRRKTRRRSKGTKDHESVLVNDNSDSNSDGNRRKTRLRSKGTKDYESVPVNDSSNSNSDGNRRKISLRSEGKKDLNVDSSTRNKKNTRSSMKTAENDSKSSKVKTASNTENAFKRNDGKSRFSRRAKETSENVSEKDRDKSLISNSSEEFETTKVGKDLTKRLSAFSMLRRKNGKPLKQKQDVDTKKNDQVSEESKPRKGNKKEDITEKDAQKRIDSDKKRSETDKEKNEVLWDKVEKDKEENKKTENIPKKKTENKGKENDKKPAVAKSMFIKPVKFKKSTRSSRLSVRPQTHRHARESSRDTADGDTEVKELIRSNLERRTSARANSVREQERTKRSDERAKPAPDQKKKTKEKDRTRRNKGTKDDESVLLNNNSDSNSAGNRRKTRRRSKGAKDHKYVLVNDNSDNKCARNRRQTRRRSKGTKDHESVLVNDNSDSNSDGNRRKTRLRSKGTKDYESVPVNDSSNSNSDGNRRKIWLRSEGEKDLNVDSSTRNKKNTRSSMKTAENDSKSSKVKTAGNTENAFKRNDGKSRFSRRAKETSENVSEKDRDKSVISYISEEFETKKVGEDLTKRLSAFSTLRRKNGKPLKQKQDVDTKKNDQVSEESKPRKGNKKKDITEKDAQKRIDSDKKRSETDKEKIEVLWDKVEKDKEEKKQTENIPKKKTENKGKENDKKPAVAKSMFIKPVKFKKSSVSNGLKYTSLEDQTIVAWLSMGNRERLVNGCAIWRELQGEYPKLTQQNRTWQSLRSRYQRYILPSLAHPALPPAQVSRLRDAPAQGLKSILKRRNSVLAEPRVPSMATARRVRFRSVSDGSA